MIDWILVRSRVVAVVVIQKVVSVFVSVVALEDVWS
jgi:hypothetical protein